MKNVYLHVGVHKTGSSSIQKSLFESKEALEQQGFSYFSEYFNGKIGVLPQDWIFYNGFNESPRIKDPERFVSILDSMPSENIIISIEALSWFIDEESIESLSLVLSTFKVQVVVYLRRQDRQFVSYIQEGSKGKGKPSNRYYGLSTQAMPEITKDGYLDYYTKICHYIKYFGIDNIKVKLFERDKLLEGDVVIDFCNEIGVNDITPLKVNESLGFQRQKVGQLLNLSKVSDKKLERFLRLNLSNQGKMLPSKDEALTFYSKFQEGNRKLNLLLQLSDNEYVFDDDFSDYPSQLNDRWSEETANETIIKLINLFSDYLNIHSGESYIDSLRNDAISLEQEDVSQAFHLMSRAYALRPNGKQIKEKLTIYKSKL